MEPAISARPVSGSHAVLRAIRWRWRWILVVVVASGAAALYLANSPDEYEAVSVVNVVPDPEYPTAADMVRLTVARLAVHLESGQVVRQVADDANVDADQLQDAVDVSITAGTANIRIAVRLESPRLAADAAKGFASQAPRFARSDPAMKAKVTALATQPQEPVGPSRGLVLILVIAVGAALAVFLAVLVERLQPRLRTDADAAAAGGAPVLGFLPQSRSGEDLSGWFRKAGVASAVSSVSAAFSAVCKQSSTQYRTVAVVAPASGCGASTVAGALAVSMTGDGRRVVLIDADLTSPVIDRLFGLPSSLGLADVILDGAPLTAAASWSPVEGLTIVPAASVSEAAGDVLTQGLGPALEQARGLSDLVLVNTAPVLEDDAGGVVAIHVDAALLVVTRHAQARDCLEAADLLRRLRTPVLGVVMTSPGSRRGRPADSEAWTLSQSRFGDGVNA